MAINEKQFDELMKALFEIRDLLKKVSEDADAQRQQPTKITVVGTGRNPVGRPPKTTGLNTDEDFSL